MKYMTAKEEDILTNQNFIKSGIVIDKLLESLIVSKINYADLLIGDKNAIMVAARILSYGKEYEFEYNDCKQSINLSDLPLSPLHEDVLNATANNFTFTLPSSENIVTFKLLNHGDDRKIDQIAKGFKKINKVATNDVTIRLGQIITSINGSTEKKDIIDFVNNYFLAKDTRAFRKHYNAIQPDIDLTVTLIKEDGGEETTELPIGVNFFWPDA
jgi:hypothetical protein